MATLTVADLEGVVYSCGKVFEGLSAGRLVTENFLRSGSLDGISSRADLALLEDLRDAAQFVIDHAGRKIDSAYVRAVNATITRSGALHPGQLRTQEQSIGVTTPYGRHTPDALTEDGLQLLLDEATRSDDVRQNALELFVELAKAQPFEDGNKRTAVFVANSPLISSRAGRRPAHDPRRRQRSKSRQNVQRPTREGVRLRRARGCERAATQPRVDHSRRTWTRAAVNRLSSR